MFRKAKKSIQRVYFILFLLMLKRFSFQKQKKINSAVIFCLLNKSKLFFGNSKLIVKCMNNHRLTTSKFENEKKNIKYQMS